MLPAAIADEIHALWTPSGQADAEKNPTSAADAADGPLLDGEGPVSLLGGGGALHTLVLVDCGRSMMPRPKPTDEPPSDAAAAMGEGRGGQSSSSISDSIPSPFQRALRGCEAMLRQQAERAFASHGALAGRGSVGVMLYNTQTRLPIRWDDVPGRWNTSARRRKRASDRDRPSSAAPRAKKPRDSGSDAEDDYDDEEEDDEEEEDEEEDDEAQDPDFLPYKTYPSCIHEFIPLEPPSVSAIYKIRAAIDGEIDLVGLYGHKPDDDDGGGDSVVDESSKESRHGRSDSHLDDALAEATNAFKKHIKGKSKDRARLWIFTNNPFACGEDKAAVLQEMVRDAGKVFRCTSIVVWPLDDNPLEEYRETIGMQVQAPTQPVAPGGGGGDADDDDGLLETMRREWTRETAASASSPALASARPKWREIPLIRPDWAGDPKDGEGCRRGGGGNDAPLIPGGILLDFYDLVSHATPPAEKEVHAYTGLSVFEETHHLASGGGPILAIKAGNKTVLGVPQDRFLSYAPLAKDVRVPLSDYDRTQIRLASNSCPVPSLVLLGFKDASNVPLYLTSDKTYFVSASVCEENAWGIDAFARLREGMARKNAVLVGEMLSSPRATSRLVALAPWIPISNSTGHPPAGMVANFFPFREEIRDTRIFSSTSSVEPLVPVSEDLKNLITKLVDKFSFSFEDRPCIGQRFANVQMDKLCRYMEHATLCEPASVDDEDKKYDTVLSERVLKKRSSKHRRLIASIMESLPANGKATDEVSPPKVSRKRIRESARELDSDWKSLYEAVDGDLSKWNVKMLKAYCKEMGMNQGGRKAELMSIVKPHVETFISSGSN